MAELLKIKAESVKEIEVLSALLQDALFRVGDMVYRKKDHRFAFVANRFCWENEGRGGHARARSGLRFEGVLSAKIKNIPLERPDVMLSLLSIDAKKNGKDFGITLIFSGDGAIRLETEVLEAYLKDLTGSWETKLRPDHPVA